MTNMDFNRCLGPGLHPGLHSDILIPLVWGRVEGNCVCRNASQMILVSAGAESCWSRGPTGYEDPSKLCKEATTRKGRMGKQARLKMLKGTSVKTSLALESPSPPQPQS